MDAQVCAQEQVLPTSSGVLARLRTLSDSLPRAEKLVAAFIEHHTDEMVRLPLKTLARRIGVSEATIIRFCRSIDYHGLRDLKLALASETRSSRQLVHGEINETDDMPTIVRKVLYGDIQAIADLSTLLDYSEFERAVEALREAPKIELYGAGGSIPLVEDAARRFMMIGLEAKAVTNPLEQVVSAAMLPPHAAVLAIQFSGRSVDTYNALRVAHDAGAVCILLTSYADSKLRRYADIQLLAPECDILLRTERIARRIVLFSAVNALHVALAIKDVDRSVASLRRNQMLLNSREVRL